MKNIAYLIFIFSLLFDASLSQGQTTPQSFNYQVIVRDDLGEVISNQAVSIRISLIQNGAPVFSETHSLMTNDYGLVNIGVGTGLATLNTISDVDWTAGFCSLKVEVDPDGGTDYIIANTSDLLSLPYVKYSANAAKMEGGIIEGTSIGSTTKSTGIFTRFTLKDVLKLTPRSTLPSDPSDGEIFVNSNNHLIYCFLNGRWEVFTTVPDVLPVVTSTAISLIRTSSATGGGEVTDVGGDEVTARGVCWNTTGMPTISDNKTTDGTGVGIFTSNITGLTDNTIYYVRAYATNSAGTAYGDEVQFTAGSGISEPEIEWIPGNGIISSARYSGGVLIGYTFYCNFRVVGESGEVTINVQTSNENVVGALGTFNVEKDGEYQLHIDGNLAGSYYAVGGFHVPCLYIIFSSPNSFTTREIAVRPWDITVWLYDNEYMTFWYCHEFISLQDITISN